MLHPGTQRTHNFELKMSLIFGTYPALLLSEKACLPSGASFRTLFRIRSRSVATTPRGTSASGISISTCCSEGRPQIAQIRVRGFKSTSGFHLSMKKVTRQMKLGHRMFEMSEMITRRTGHTSEKLKKKSSHHIL